MRKGEEKKVEEKQGGGEGDRLDDTADDGLLSPPPAVPIHYGRREIVFKA